MNRKRTFTALLIAFVMIVQSLCGVVLAQDESAAKTPVEIAEVDFFGALDMLPEGLVLYREEGMTRGQFAYIAARLSGWTGSEQGETPFVDVADMYANKDAITYLYNTNIVQGTGGLKFNPEENITLIDATSIMIKILGYSTIATAKYGEYPLSHLRMGDFIDLYDGFIAPGTNDELTSEQALMLLKNAAVAPMAVPTVFGDVNEYTFESKNTLLYNYYDIVISEGVVTDDGVSAINGPTSVELGAAVISGFKLSKSQNGFSANGLLGMYVDYYYTEGNKKLVYAEVQANSGDILTLTYDMLAPGSSDFTLTNIVYYNENDKIKNAKISSSVDLVYNGGAYPGFVEDDLKIKSGFMVLIDRDTDKVYDAINITEYDDVIIKGYDTTAEVIYGEGKTIKLEDYTQSVIRDLDGNVLTLDSLKTDTVASIAAAKDKSYIEIISCAKNIVQGPVTYAETSEKIYYVFDKGYELSSRFYENQAAGYLDSEEPEIGETYRLLLNADGRIVKAVHMESDGWYSGYCIGVGPDGTGLGASAKMRAMTPQGGLLDLYFGNKVSVNGEPGITPEKLLENDNLFGISNGEKYPLRQPVKYKLDSWGKITAIETPVDNTTEDKKEIYKLGFDLENFSKDAEIDNAPYKADLVKAISGMYFLKDSTLVISDPYLTDPVANAYESEDVEILSVAGLNHGEKGRTFIYDADEGYNVDAVVFAGSVGDTNVNFNDYDNRTQQLFLVDKVMRRLDEEGEVVKVIAGYCYGSYVEYPEYEEGVIPEDIKWGDVCTYKVSDNQLVGIKVLMSLDTETYPDMDENLTEAELYNISYCNGDERNAEIHDNVWSTQYGPVYSVSEKSFVLMLAERITPNYKIAPLFGYSTNGGNVKVTVLDRASKTIRPGTFGDVYTNVIPRSMITDVDGDGKITRTDYGIDELTPRAFVYRRYSYAREVILIK